jgi:hypothetical protein
MLLSDQSTMLNTTVADYTDDKALIFNNPIDPIITSIHLQTHLYRMVD